MVPDDPPDALTRKLEKHLIGLLSTQLRTRLETFFREELAQGGADMTRQVAAKSQTAGRAPPQQQPRPWVLGHPDGVPPRRPAWSARRWRIGSLLQPGPQ